MKNKIYKIIFKTGVFFVSLLMLSFSLVFVADAESMHKGKPQSYSHHYHRPSYHRHYLHRYFYWHRFYHPWFFSFSIIIPSVGTVVSHLPCSSTKIIIRDETYYYCDGVYYKAYHGGYVVVPAPKEAYQ